MALCINPTCTEPNHPANGIHSQCQSCGADLIIQGRYRVMRLLTASSGFGQVYEVFERDQPKILKVLKPHYNTHPKAVQLFEQEALVLSRLDHPGMPQIDIDGCFQFMPIQGKQPLHCIVMEKIDGPNLSEWMRQQGNHPISETQAVKWLQQLAEILNLLHQHQYFHRDIKPDNIMIRSTGQLVLVDFGAAREMSYTYFERLDSTEGITRVSSAGYTPPEQERGQAVPQSDFYSLGCTFIYLLTGKKPTDVDIYHVLTNEYNWRPYAQHISSDLANFIDRLTAPRVLDRPKTTQELMVTVNHLQELLQQKQHSTSELTDNQGQDRSDRPFPSSIEEISPRSSSERTSDFSTTGENIENGTLPPDLSAFPSQHSQRPSPPPSLVSAANTSSVNTVVNRGGSTLLQPWRIEREAELVPSRGNRLQLLGLGIGLVGVVGLLFWGGRFFNGSQPQESDTPTTTADVPVSSQDPNPSSPTQNRFTVTPSAPLEGHNGIVNALALSSDEQTLVSGSNDKTVRIWDLTTGQTKHELVGHEDRIYAVAISPNGQVVASGGGDGVIKLWDVDSGEAIADLVGHSTAINAIAITSDGNTLASVSTDKTIKVWDLASNTELATLVGHSSYINGLDISPDGRLLATGAADRTIKLWSLASQQEVATLTGHTSFVNTVIFSLDGTKIISGAADNTIKIWDLNTYGLLHTLEHHTSFINALTLSSDGQFLISSSADQTIVLWNLKTQKPVESIVWGNTLIETLVQRSSGATLQILAGGQGSNVIQVWDVKR